MTLYLTTSSSCSDVPELRRYRTVLCGAGADLTDQVRRLELQVDS